LRVLIDRGCPYQAVLDTKPIRAVIEDFCRNRIGHSVSALVGMVKTKFGAMSLYAGRPGRKYLNDKERRRFLLATRTAPVKVRLFRRIMACSRSRISEALALTPRSFDLDEGVVIFETLKRRKRGIMRQVPLPPDLMRQLDKTLKLRAGQRDRMLADQRIWTWSRTTAWRYIKELMCRAGNCWTRGNAERVVRHASGLVAPPAVAVGRPRHHDAVDVRELMGHLPTDHRERSTWHYI
jgi:integrase/recombinase XerD